MSIEKGLLAEEDLSLGTGTFTRRGRTGFPITVTKVSDLIDGANGPLVDARRFTNFNDAIAAAVGKTLLIAGSTNLPSGAITIPVTVSVFPLQSGVINKSSATSLTINGPVVGDPKHQWLSGFAAGEVFFGTLVSQVGSIWAGTGETAINILKAALDAGGIINMNI